MNYRDKGLSGSFFYSESSQSYFLIQIVLANLNVSKKIKSFLAPQIVQHRRIITQIFEQH